jgi:hypothetical protein
MASNGTNGNGEGAAPIKEEINYDIITLTRHLTEEQTKHKEATGDFTYDGRCSHADLPTDNCTDSSATLSNSPSSPSHTTSDEPL